MKFSILNKPKRVRPTDRGLQNKRIFESTCDPSCDGCENARGPIPYVDTRFMIGRAHFLIEIVFFSKKCTRNRAKKRHFFFPISRAFARREKSHRACGVILLIVTNG